MLHLPGAIEPAYQGDKVALVGWNNERTQAYLLDPFTEGAVTFSIRSPDIQWDLRAVFLGVNETVGPTLREYRDGQLRISDLTRRLTRR